MCTGVGKARRAMRRWCIKYGGAKKCCEKEKKEGGRERVKGFSREKKDGNHSVKKRGNVQEENTHAGNTETCVKDWFQRIT